MTVYLIGVGPGGAGMLTCRAEDLLAQADIVVYDRGLAEDVLALISPTARLVATDTAGDATGDTTGGGLSRWGRTHACVVRLFDSAVDVAPDARPDHQVVPGVTPAFATPASAGIPVMDRARAACVTVLTRTDPTTDWRTLARTGGTLVVVGARGRLDPIVDGLGTGGLGTATPVATVSATGGARISTLHTLADHDVAADTVLVIGPVVTPTGTIAPPTAPASPTTSAPVGTDSVPILRRPASAPGPSLGPTPPRTRG